MLKKIILLSFLCTVLGLQGCGSSQSGQPDPVAQAQKPQETAPSSGNTNADPLKKAAEAAAESIAKESFSETLANGDKKLNLINVVVEYVRSDTKDNTVREQWTADCVAAGQFNIKGEYPNLNVGFGGFDCGSTHSPNELDHLHFLIRSLSYSAHHIPAYPSEPNQFQLNLQNVDSSFFNWNSFRSLNANVKDRVVDLDFLGEERGELGRGYEANHFVQITYKQSDDLKSESIKIQYDYDQISQQEKTEIKIKADVVRAH